jgi:hypothetical protein
MSGQIPHGAAASREHIPPVSGGDRPLWSVMIPTHNCAAYLRETLQSVLAQDPGPARMQIEVVDDHSTADDPEAVVRELGGGRVAFYRQPRNLGHVGNFNSCLQRSRGLLVHLLHGDDRVRKGFYRALEQPFLRHPEIGAAFCRAIVLDEQGRWKRFTLLERREAGVLDDWLELIASGQRLQTPSVVVRRAVFERLGGFDPRLSWSEDCEMWVRIAASYPVWFEPEPLAEYRQHGTSSTARQQRTGENVQDFRRAIEITRAYLPHGAGGIYHDARRWTAHRAIDTAWRVATAGNWQTASVQLREALRTSRAPGVVRRVVYLWCLAALRRLRSGRIGGGVRRLWRAGAWLLNPRETP